MAADQLATPQDLADALQISLADLNTATATLLLEMATAVVQEACGGQRIVQVVDDVVTLLGTSDSWLDLPQIPVTAVASVVLDGTTLTVDTDYKVLGNRIWSSRGWQTNVGTWWSTWPSPAGLPPDWFLGPEPSAVVVTYTHGYAAAAQELQLARSAVLTLAAPAYTNPPRPERSESVDDYSVSYVDVSDSPAMDLSPFMRAALRKRYGRRGGLVRVG